MLLPWRLAVNHERASGAGVFTVFKACPFGRYLPPFGSWDLGLRGGRADNLIRW